jgi:arginyl-tRNA synthetase
VEENQEETIQNIAFSSLKYYDLSMKRTSDYVFSLDKMLNLKGNSGPYLLYAYTRINSIINKAHCDIKFDKFTMNTPDEKQLGLCILQLTDTINIVTATLMFHHLALYMYKLASTFHSFIQKNQVLKFDEEGNVVEINYDRLILCHMTKMVLEKCFFLMGMKTIEQM